MLRMIRRRRAMDWRHEPGPGYDLREYHWGVPTGWVAVAVRGHGAPGSDVFQIPGHHVLLIIERNWITVIDRSTEGQDGVRLHAPFGSCVDMKIFDEPGLPGTASVRLDLLVHIGLEATVTVPMWFPGEQRPWLDQLARLVLGRREPALPQPTAQPLPLLEIERAPDTSDWLVFLAHPSSAEVLRPRRNGETR
jgi:hypothetical protein